MIEFFFFSDFWKTNGSEVVMFAGKTVLNCSKCALATSKSNYALKIKLYISIPYIYRFLPSMNNTIS